MLSHWPARLEVGVGGLAGAGRDAVVVDQRARAVGEAQRIGIKAGVHVADDEPVGRELLFDLDADVGLAEAVGHPLPARVAAGLGDQFPYAVVVVSVESAGVRLVAAAHVDRAVDRDPHIGQRAVGRGRVQPAIESRVAIWLLGRRRGLLGRQVGRLRGADGEQPSGRGQEQVFQKFHNQPHRCRRPLTGSHGGQLLFSGRFAHSRVRASCRSSRLRRTRRARPSRPRQSFSLLNHRLSRRKPNSTPASAA